MSNEAGQLLTPLTPTASSTAEGVAAGPSGSTDGADPVATAPHTAFPSASELGLPAPMSSSDGGPTGFERYMVPTTPEALFDLIRNSVREDTLIGTLEHVCGGPLMPPMTASQPKQAVPSPVIFLPGLDFRTLSDEVVSQCTIGLLYVLSARLNVRAEQPFNVLEDAARFCYLADPAQLASISARVTEFAWSFLRYAQMTNRVHMTLAPLDVLLRNTSSASFFNPVHAVFLEACTYDAQYEAGERSLGVLYTNVDEGTSYIDVLTYHHHAGTILAVCGQFARATDFFTFAAAMPTSSLSAIQTACAKRAILCELINTGRSLQFPRDTSSSVNRVLDKSIPEYTALAKAFANADWKMAREAASAGAVTFAEDRNMGLVEQVIGSITKRRILNLRKTYSRMTVADLTKKVGLEGPDGEQQVVDTIMSMVAANEIRATIDSGHSAIVAFLGDDDYASPENMAKMKHAQQLTAWLHADLERGNRAIGLDKRWLSKQSRYNNKDKAGSKKGTFDRNDEDLGIPAGSVRGVGSNLADMGF